MELRNYAQGIRPAAAGAGYTPLQIAAAYHFVPDEAAAVPMLGAGRTIAFLELGGKFAQADLDAYCAEVGVPTAKVDVQLVAGGRNVSDGPGGADGEVMLDVEVAHVLAPAARKVVIQAPNTDAGFMAGVQWALAHLAAGDALSISWGAAEDQWDPQVMASLDVAFAALKTAGVTVTCASGDNGSRDGESRPVTDYPSSSASVVACGGTSLTIDGGGQRAAETTWAGSGGGKSARYDRDVPDVAGCADPATGWRVRVDGQAYVIGGTSAVAPMVAALAVRLSAVAGPFDLMAAVGGHPEVCFDVTAGSNGDYRAGPGRDFTTGFGVVDGARLRAVLPGVTETPTPVPVPTPGTVLVICTTDQVATLDKWAAGAFAARAPSAAWRAARRVAPGKG